MDFIKKKLENLSLKNTVQATLQKINIYHKVQQPIQRNYLIQIQNNLYHMPFPTQQIKQKILNQIVKKFGKINYNIWNISQNKYDVQYFNNQVNQNCFANYPNLPLKQLLLIAINIKKWLTASNNNYAIVHCKDNKCRSAIILSIYLYLQGKYEFLDQALIQINKKLQINKQQTFFPSQHISLKNCMNFFHGYKINNKTLKLIKIVCNQIPKIIRKNNDGTIDKYFLPHIQIYSQNKKIYQSPMNKQGNNNKNRLFFQINKNIKNDFLIWMKHTHKNLRYSCFRVLLDTNFIQSQQPFVRINMKDLDVTQNIQLSKNYFMDLFFQEVNIEKQDTSQLYIVYKQIKKVFKQRKYYDRQNEQKQNILQESLKNIINNQINTPNIENSDAFQISEQIHKKQEPHIQNLHKIILQQIQVQPQQQQDIDDYISKLQQQN